VQDRKEAQITFASTEEAKKAEMLVAEGHLTDISAGYKPLESIYVPKGESTVINGRTFIGPIKVTKRWMLKEGSLVPIGADIESVVRAPEIMQELIQRGLPKDATGKEIIQFMRQELQKNNSQFTIQSTGGSMTPEELAAQKAAKEEQDRIAKEAREKAAKEAQERVSGIYELASRYAAKIPKMDELRSEALKEQWTIERFSQEILTRMSSTSIVEPATGDPGSVSVEDVVQPWVKRSILTLHTLTAQARGSDKFELFARQLNEARKNLNQRQVQAERAEAIEIIKKSRLSRGQQIRLMSTLTAGAGGALLPAPFLAELFVIIEERGLARRTFRPIPMVSKTLDLSTVATKPVAVWATEGSNATSTEAVFGEGQLSAEKLTGLAPWTSELEEDSAIALIPVLQELIAESIFEKEDAAGFKGDGSSTYGNFTGLVNAATAGVTMDAGKTAFDDLDAEDLRAVRDAVSLARRRGAEWFMHPDIISVVEGLKDLQGRYIYRGPGDNRPATLWGYPIANNGEGIESMPDLTESGASKKFICFGNPKRMLMGQRRELDLLVSREGILNSAANNISFNALQADGAIIRLTERVAFKLPLGDSFSFLKTAAA
jgi:HK97 family phage major capsid protein